MKRLKQQFYHHVEVSIREIKRRVNSLMGVNKLVSTTETGGVVLLKMSK